MARSPTYKKKPLRQITIRDKARGHGHEGPWWASREAPVLRIEGHTADEDA